MRSHFLVQALSLLFVRIECRPHTHSLTHTHGHLHGSPLIDVRDSLPTCAAISGVVDSGEDLKAKERAEPGVCPNEAYHLLKRQAASTVDDYSCGPSNPCKNGACCAKSGYCGYGPDSCGDGTSPNDKCWSNCDANAECGRYAEKPGTECPLNVCCSQFGFCGMTEDFCAKTDNVNTTCQSNCDQPKSGGSGSDVQSRIVGYYEAWNWKKNCIGMQLKDIPVSSITHLHYSFAYIAPSSYEITTMDDTVPVDLFSGITALKTQNPDLKVIVSIGGWTFNDNGTVTQPLFGEIAGNSGNRAKFIANLLDFMQNYGFDGVDFDWEYPGAGDRGGNDDDGVNYTHLLSDLRDKFSGVISFTAPTSYWYLRHFDLKASAQHVDWINVMSYDLHGTWDSSDPIGNHVLAHTNLTEIKLALDLYWRNSIPADKINLGLGFYGRSFQLSDPSCYQPGCLFKGGASPGVCTDNSGTLSYREIMDIIDQYNLKPYYDKENQVKYITWNSDQWVSYDDQDTFQAKIKFSNDNGLGGLLIWSLDQDTTQLDALAGVIYPKRLGSIGAEAESANNWDELGGGDCRVTSCGTTGCNAGEVHMVDQQCDGKKHLSSLCCPFSSAPDPKTCSWRGGPTWCNGRCHPGEVALESNAWGDHGHCKDGLKFYCCPAVNEIPDCRWTDCGESCDSSTENSMTWDDENCFSGRQNFCCSKKQDWKNCAWHGKGGSCFDNHCDTGHSVSLTTSYAGEGTSCGIHLERERSFCCDAADGKSPFLPVPLDYLFKAPPTGDDVDADFTLKVDPTYGGSTEGPSFSDDPVDGEFGFVVMASPEELQITLDKRDGSHWDVFDCSDSRSEDEQTVRMVCTDDTDNSNCHKIYLGAGAPGTIVEMPRGCGPGKYAVVKTLEPSSDQRLPSHLVKRNLEAATIYDLTFDYDFSRVPRDLGDTQIRIDSSNELGYWDKVVDKAASKRKVKRDLSQHDGNHRRWLEDAWREDVRTYGHGHPELHKRWFGSDVISWLKGLINGDSDGLDIPLVSNSYVDDFTVLILDESFPDCPIGPKGTTVNGKLKVQATTHVDIETNFGFTLITTLASFDLSNSYLYFRNRGDVSAKFTADAVAQATWKSPDVTLLSADRFGATFSVPGIVTIGPNFKLVGNVKGTLTLAANFEASVNIAKWDVRQTYPTANNDWDPQSKQTPDRDGTQELYTPEFQYGVQASGSIEAHIMPIVTFGIEFGSKLSDASATVNLVADGHVTFHATASKGSTTSFCYGIDAGADLYATVQAPKFPGWTLPSSKYQLAQTPAIAIVPNTCPISSRSVDEDWFSTNETIALAEPPRSSLTVRSAIEKRANVYGPVFRIPKISCPNGGGAGGDAGDCLFCQPASDAISKRDGETCDIQDLRSDESTCSDLGGASKRDLEALLDSLATNDTAVDQHADHLNFLEKRKPKLADWATHGITQEINWGDYPSCNAQAGSTAAKSGASKWWGFESSNTPPSTCPTDISKLTVSTISGPYQTDHVFEVQTLMRFFDFLRQGGQFPNPPPLPAGYTAASDAWVTGTVMGITGLPVQPGPIPQVRGHADLLDALRDNIGHTGTRTNRMALVAAEVNNAKGNWFGLGTPGAYATKSTGLRATKAHVRNAAGVFQYMKADAIFSIWQTTSFDIEASMIAFDNSYPWGSQNGELGRPARGANQPMAGLRDLYCYFMDRYMATIEANAGPWPNAIEQTLATDKDFKGSEGQKFLNNFFLLPIATQMNFRHPGTGQRNAGNEVVNSVYGAWDGGNGAAGPF